MIPEPWGRDTGARLLGDQYPPFCLRQNGIQAADTNDNDDDGGGGWNVSRFKSRPPTCNNPWYQQLTLIHTVPSDFSRQTLQGHSSENTLQVEGFQRMIKSKPPTLQMER